MPNDPISPRDDDSKLPAPNPEKDRKTSGEHDQKASGETVPDPIAPAPRFTKTRSKFSAPGSSSSKTLAEEANKIPAPQPQLSSKPAIQLDVTPSPIIESTELAPAAGEEFPDDLSAWEDPPAPSVKKEKNPSPPVSNPLPTQETADFCPPGTKRPKVRRPFTTAEKLSLVLLCLLLVGTLAVTYRFTIARLPENNARGEVRFPFEGSLVTITSLKTNWRIPAASDSVRLETAIIPEISCTFSKANGAVRARFVNDRAETVGDILTLRPAANGTLKFSATAGFNDMALYTAYRAENSPTWTVELSEAPRTDSPAATFKPLFTTSVSSILQP